MFPVKKKKADKKIVLIIAKKNPVINAITKAFK